MGIGSSADDYKDIMIKLSPVGICWATEDTSTWVKLLDALAQEYARADGAAVELLQEAFPDTTSLLLPNWERIMGLPDVFSDPDATIDERRSVVLTKIRARGGQSADYLSDVVQDLGYVNSITECYPFSADISYSGDYLFDIAWLYYFIVRVEGDVPDHALFEARFRSLQPAQTVSIFIYD